MSRDPIGSNNYNTVISYISHLTPPGLCSSFFFQRTKKAPAAPPNIGPCVLLCVFLSDNFGCSLVVLLLFLSVPYSVLPFPLYVISVISHGQEQFIQALNVRRCLEFTIDYLNLLSCPHVLTTFFLHISVLRIYTVLYKGYVPLL